MKKLDKLLLKTFVGPFVLTFVITLFIFVMQFLFVYIDDLIGKGLEWYIIMELIAYSAASLVPLVLPLAILLSSIMTYGNLGEHYELVALKAAGIPLTRFMMPLFVAVFFIGIGSFYFSNVMLPKINLKAKVLLRDIRNQKPALNIKPGVFYSGIQGYSIKVGAKDDDNRTIRDILVYDHTTGKGNDNVLTAKRGDMIMSADGRYLILKLYDGTRYNEAVNAKASMEHYTTSFAEWTKVFDLSEFEFDKSDENAYGSHHQMMNMRELSAEMDTIRMEIEKRKTEFDNNIAQYFQVLRPGFDTIKPSIANDSIFKAHMAEIEGKTDSEEKHVQSLIRATSFARNVKSFGGAASRDFAYHEKKLRKHDIERHRKVVYALACIVMFIIGAPLGAIIRIGGLGYPLLFSIIFFLVFHVTGISGSKIAEEGGTSVAFGMWLSTIILLPIGVFLTVKAVNDSPLFNRETYYRFTQKLFGKKVVKAKAL
ncbi:MAG: LptF/LptG family permease [Chitinophagales bacterium]|nr:LptF/LptG family permease [Chitinophagales bacterium]